MMAGESEWLVWQWVDSAFPAGGFAHSGGLEAAVQLGEVPDRASLEAFLQASLEQVGHASLPLVSAAHAAPERLPELDALCEAFTTNHVANRASRLQGRALLLVADRIFALPPLPDPSAVIGHLTPVFGSVTARLGLARETVQRLFLFWHLRGLVAAAVRLNRIGPLEAQSLQRRLATTGEAVRLRCGDLGLEDLAQTVPLQDLWQGLHDRLPMRLFQS